MLALLTMTSLAGAPRPRIPETFHASIVSLRIELNESTQGEGMQV